MELTWEAPGPGWWFLAREHLPTPVDRLFAELLPVAAHGWATSRRAYGVPSGAPTFRSVNGWLYYGPGTVDPATYDELARNAEETLRTARWRDDVRRWHDVDRPRVVAANLALQDAPPDVAAAIDHFCAVAPLHFEMHTSMNVGGGVALRELRAVGLDLADVLPLLAGASPGSARARALIDAIARDEPGARDAYLREHGWRCLDHKGIGETLIERPDVVDASVAARRAGHGGEPPAPDVASVRARASDPERFDAALTDLRDLYGLNDDNVGITFGWPLGLLRRAVLAESERRGIDAHLLFQCTPAELVGEAPPVDELARRAAIVDAAPDADPPPFFAGEDDAPPLPPAPAIVREMEVISAELWSAEVKPTEAMHGVGIGDRSYRGRACRIDDGDGMALLEPGDVIVALVTHAGHNSVFPIAGAVATELGGALSHPAVLARELGLPAVVGVTGLLEHVRTGDQVEVDPVAGVVRVLERPT